MVSPAPLRLAGWRAPLAGPLAGLAGLARPLDWLDWLARSPGWLDWLGWLGWLAGLAGRFHSIRVLWKGQGPTDRSMTDRSTASGCCGKGGEQAEQASRPSRRVHWSQPTAGLVTRAAAQHSDEVPEPITATAPTLGRPIVFGQQWQDLAMLHWAVEPALVAPLLPGGTAPDVFEGSTYVGLIPFSMTGVRVLGSPPLPHLSAFAETNVRLYAVDGRGRRGVVFRSLEASRLLPVLAARVGYHLPYCWSRMRVERDGDLRTWTTARRWPGPRRAGGQIRVRTGEPYPADPLSLFLTARWGLFSTWYGGATAWAPVEHEPWPLHRAELLGLSDNLVAVAGLPVAGPPDHVLWTPGVTVRIGRPRRLTA